MKIPANKNDVILQSILCEKQRLLFIRIKLKHDSDLFLFFFFYYYFICLFFGHR